MSEKEEPTWRTPASTWKNELPSMAAASARSVNHSRPASPGDSPRPAGRSGSYQITVFVLGPSAHEILCAPLRVKSLFPLVPWGSCK